MVPFRTAAVLLLLSPWAFAQKPALDDLKKQAVADIDKRAVFTQQMVDSIFSFAELGFQEFQTSRYLTDLLEKQGFKVEKGVAGLPTGWVATWGSGKPVIGFMTDIDCIPRASQKPGVAYHDPIIEGAPGHGEGHNSGMAVNITAALVLKDLMTKNRISGTLKIYPGVAEELLGTKAYMVRAGLFKDIDIMLGAHVGNDFNSKWGQPSNNSGLVSLQFTFKGQTAHAAGAPQRGKSALDAVELMNMAWNMRREHMRIQQRSHYVITNGGDQPNVVPELASVWYFIRETDYLHIKENLEAVNTIAKSAATMTGTTVSTRVLGTAWPYHLNKVVAEAQTKNIEAVGMPVWSEDDQKLARALQRELGQKAEGLKMKVEPAEGQAKVFLGGGTDDIGDISWNVPMVYLYYPANIPGLPGHHWSNAVAMATPIAHKGSTAGAKVQAMTALDFLLQPQLVDEAWKYLREVQTKDVKYTPLISDADQPAIELNKEKMDTYGPQLKKFYYDPSRFKTYLDQLGIQYPTVKQ